MNQTTTRQAVTPEKIAELVRAAHDNSVKHGFWGVVGNTRPVGSTDLERETVCLPCGHTFRFAAESKAPMCPSCKTVDDPTQRDLPTKFALIHSEISEALEEFRTSKESQLGQLLFVSDKPVGFISELADVAIRLFDLAGWFGRIDEKAKQLASAYLLSPYVGAAALDRLLIPGVLFEIHETVTGLRYYGTRDSTMAEMFYQIEYLARRVGGDLWQAVDVKMAYNKTRPIKHGKVV